MYNVPPYFPLTNLGQKSAFHTTKYGNLLNIKFINPIHQWESSVLLNIVFYREKSEEKTCKR